MFNVLPLMSCSTLDEVTIFLGKIAGYIWSMPLVILLVGSGVYFSIRLIFPQFRRIGHSIAVARGKYDNPDDPGDITHFQALCAALSATVGVGNIAGVAIALHAGGPGSIFWMWVAALFGMVTKYAECTLSHKYRVIHSDGTISGGPMYYIEKGLGDRFKWLAIAFAICGLIATFGGGNMVQSNSMTIAFTDQFATQKFHNSTPLSKMNNGKETGKTENTEFIIKASNGKTIEVNTSRARTVSDLLNAINDHPGNRSQIVMAEIATDRNSIEFTDFTEGNNEFTIASSDNDKLINNLGFINDDGSINKLSNGKISTVVPEKPLLRAILGVAISAIVGMVIIGGIKRIGKVASRLVPVMSSIYVAGALFIILWNYGSIADSFYLIFKHAFTPTAATGGFAGATVLYAITWGVRRAAFSNEAGLGSAPIAHAAAKTKEPVREGLVAMMGPLIDTLVICTMTALVIIITGEWTGKADSSVLTKNAFNAGIPYFGGVIVAIGLILFAISTAISWSYYGDRCTEYLFGRRAIMPYRCVYVVALFVGAMVQLEFVWNFSDITLGLMAIPNLIAIIALSSVVISLTKDYFSRKHIRTN
ncbi:MAG: amino acid carrier protein [Candidatus Scalindua sp.]|nr:amino acid carrier protein [Candidatus Scalindua sp.]MDV5166843.1 amino acid carrier protein [Candidatus Scalindua sp.]